jgi:hypothetical protein
MRISFDLKQVVSHEAPLMYKLIHHKDGGNSPSGRVTT